jgi:4-carboxymuconolactone decarboxylase
MSRIEELIPAPLESDWTKEQRNAVQEIASGPRGALIGPFKPMLHSPILMERLQKTGEFIRWHSEMPDKIREMVILMVARHWNQEFEWSFHKPIASSCGLASEVIVAIGNHEKPLDLGIEEMVVWNLINEVLNDGTASDTTVRNALEVFGPRNVVEYVATVGYYSTLAFIMNVAGTESDTGDRLPPRKDSQ